MTNQQRFQAELTEAYRDLFVNDPEYQYSAARITPEALAAKMSAGLLTESANKDGAGIKRACKACGIKQTYAAIKAYFAADQASGTPTGV
jgi:hypothetical protein